MQYLSVNTISISIDFVKAAVQRVPLQVSDVDTLLYDCRISRSLLSEPDARVSLTQYAQLITALMNASNDELLGYAREPLPVGSLSILCHWLVAAETMGQVLHRFARFYQIMGKGMDISVEVEGDQFYIEIGNAFHAPDSDPFIDEFAFFCIHRILCWLRKDIFPIDHLYFPSAAPRCVKDYRLMFYGAPAAFNCDYARIVFARELLDKPVRQDTEGLSQLLEDPFTQLLVLNFYGESWSSKIGKEIRKSLDDLPTLPVLARQMNVPPYTLQRRLAEEGVTYLAIKNQIKRDAAIEMLVHTDLSIEDISHELGFSETSPFTRTFKSWTGVPPSAYRKRRAPSAV